MRFTDVTESGVIFRCLKSYIRYRTKCSGDNAFVTPMADTHNITCVLHHYVLIPQALKYISVIYAMVKFQAVIFQDAYLPPFHFNIYSIFCLSNLYPALYRLQLHININIHWHVWQDIYRSMYSYLLPRFHITTLQFMHIYWGQAYISQ